jgi:hypothetical protein
MGGILDPMVFKICHDRAEMSPVQRIPLCIQIPLAVRAVGDLTASKTLTRAHSRSQRYCSNSLQHGEPLNGMKPLMPKTSQASSVGWQPRYECTRSNPSARSLRPSPLHHHDYARAAARVAQRCPPNHCGDRDPALERRAGMAGREGLRPVVMLPVAVSPARTHGRLQFCLGALGAAAACIASPRSASTASCS